MKVLNLRCAHEHGFEGWFGSEDDFQSQLGRGLVECPLCGDKTITKGLTAPRLNFGASAPAHRPQALPEAVSGDALQAGSEQASASRAAPPAAALQQALQHAWLRRVREVMAHTEDVGERFAEEARRMHYGEAAERGIRGQASREEAEALLDEGIAVLPLPLPKGLKGPLQ